MLRICRIVHPTLPMNNQPLQILYLNCQGLGLEKLGKILDHYLPTCPLIFLSETWFVDHTLILQHPNLLQHSALATFHANRHQSGGIACFCSNSLRSRISSVRSTTHSITVHVDSLKVLGVYFEPSLSEQHLSNHLFSCTAADIVLGDVNVQYGSDWGGISCGPRPRLNIINQYCNTFNLSHIRPTGLCPRNDHVYARPPLSVSFHVEDAPVRSDHSALCVLIPPVETSDAPPEFGVRRYFLRCLDNPRCTSTL